MPIFCVSKFESSWLNGVARIEKTQNQTYKNKTHIHTTSKIWIFFSVFDQNNYNAYNLRIFRMIEKNKLRRLNSPI